jgi:hypothetical protein
MFSKNIIPMAGLELHGLWRGSKNRPFCICVGVVNGNIDTLFHRIRHFVNL